MKALETFKEAKLVAKTCYTMLVQQFYLLYLRPSISIWINENCMMYIWIQFVLFLMSKLMGEMIKKLLKHKYVVWYFHDIWLEKINYYNGCSVHCMFNIWVSLMSQWIEIDKNGHFLLNLTFFQGYNRVFNQHGKNFY